jgi:(4-(4-[2-(gamma-L-glutamylamino)ethyl]phenoxymethyl)furan-2-yl)methanamine synthase
MTVLGWDIGGVNTKVACVNGGTVLDVRSRPFELQHDPGALVKVLRELASETGGSDADTHAVTMTAELSQMFRAKRDGVHFVLDAIAAAFPDGTICVYAVDGRFRTVADAREAPLLVAAANWAATARVVAQSLPDALLIDIGTTSTDIIPIVDGEIAVSGWTDPDRLASGELVYSGAVRTSVEALAPSVPLQGRQVGLSAEAFALSGDVHVWRGDLEPTDYSTPTPDRRPTTREFVGERLARAICADREMLDEAGVTEIADALAAAQARRIAAAIGHVLARHPGLRVAAVTGLGSFIAERAARLAGLDVVSLASALGSDAARCAPAASVALLLEHHVRRAGASAFASPRTLPPSRSALRRPGKGALYATQQPIATVVKVGGGLLAHGSVLDTVLNVLAELAREEPLLIVPGGGPFADAVRDQDARCALTDDAAHWMAVLGMDQYAHLIVSRMPRAVLVTDASEISTALASEQIPVLAPYAWLRRADPLPHSWAVTSDSIAAWMAHAIGARRLVLVKPPGAATGADVVDDYFVHIRGKLGVETISADAIEALSRSMRP